MIRFHTIVAWLSLPKTETMTSTAVAEAAQRNIKEPGGITVASSLT